MRTIPVLMLALLLVAGIGLSACSDGGQADRDGLALADDQNFLTDTEKQFIDYAAEMHIGEIAMAQDAKQKSSNEEVKNYADDVIQTHSEALDDLRGSTKGLAELSKDASGDTQGHSKYLALLSGAQYDKEFMDLMVADHKSAAETFNMEYRGAQNTNLRRYIKETQSELQARWDEARDVQTKIASR
jgi:putative membrane protein